LRPYAKPTKTIAENALHPVLYLLYHDSQWAVS